MAFTLPPRHALPVPALSSLLTSQIPCPINFTSRLLPSQPQEFPPTRIAPAPHIPPAHVFHNSPFPTGSD
ncbi:hypothetical protein E2C01_080374 [Portunus trituberculatus]|uniref:Uncharacterized protein n=1 Tax=Portunus trituberculatus TaxID=210409 RepID=A0A5B7IP51_PORTR|nr:hypothetical protein [Portunus trituberculatus]